VAFAGGKLAAEYDTFVSYAHAEGDRVRRGLPGRLAYGRRVPESQEGWTMDAGAGDRIVVESERAAQSSRAGLIEEVLADQPPRYRVRWDDGRTSIFAPSAGVARIEKRKRVRVKA
jgi:hypothetical protein